MSAEQRTYTVILYHNCTQVLKANVQASTPAEALAHVGEQVRVTSPDLSFSTLNIFRTCPAPAETHRTKSTEVGC